MNEKTKIFYELYTGGVDTAIETSMSIERVIEYASNRLEANPEDKNKWKFDLSSLTFPEAIAIIADYGEEVVLVNETKREQPLRTKYEHIHVVDEKVVFFSTTLHTSDTKDENGFFVSEITQYAIEAWRGKQLLHEALDYGMQRNAYAHYKDTIDRFTTKYKIIYTDIKDCSDDLSIDELLRVCGEIAAENSYEVVNKDGLWAKYLEVQKQDGYQYPVVTGLKETTSELSVNEKLELCESILETTEDRVVFANNHLEKTVAETFYDCTQNSPGSKEENINNCIDFLATDFWENYGDGDLTREELRDKLSMFPYSENDIAKIEAIARAEGEKYTYGLDENGDPVVERKKQELVVVDEDKTTCANNIDKLVNKTDIEQEI